VLPLRHSKNQKWLLAKIIPDLRKRVKWKKKL
jgi:hypothetical protein